VITHPTDERPSRARARAVIVPNPSNSLAAPMSARQGARAIGSMIPSSYERPAGASILPETAGISASRQARG
jgi:hypothetical protein